MALSGFAVSEDGKYLAYGLSTSGSDWQEWKVREIETGNDLSDSIKWVKFSGASWTTDGKGFFYSRYDEPNEKTNLQDANYYQKLFYHRLGAPQSDDVLVYERQDRKEWGFDGHVTEDGRYLIVSVSKDTDPKNLVFYQDLQSPDAKVIELINEFEAAYDFIGNDGTVFWFLTDRDAPRGRVIAIDTNNPGIANWKELIPQAAETMEEVNLVGDHFIVSYLKDACAADQTIRPERKVCAPSRSARHRDGGRLRRQAQRH